MPRSLTNAVRYLRKNRKAGDILLLIVQQKRRQQARDLFCVVSCSRTEGSQILRALEANGLITRSRTETNARICHTYLATERGIAALGIILDQEQLAVFDRDAEEEEKSSLRSTTS